MKVSDLIKKLEPYKDFELNFTIHLDVKEEVLDKRLYPYPQDNYDAEICIDDIGYSDNVVLIGITPKGEEYGG